MKGHALLSPGNVDPDGSKGRESQGNDCESSEITYAYISKEGKDRINELQSHIHARTIGPYD